MTYAFSDGSPFAELAALGVTFLVFVGATKIIRQTRASESLDRGLDAIAGFLRRRLFVVDDPQTEQQRLDLLRIILASMAFLRNAANLATALQLGEATVIAATGAATALSFLLIVGFAVPLTAAVFCVTSEYDPRQYRSNVVAEFTCDVDGSDSARLSSGWPIALARCDDHAKNRRHEPVMGQLL